MTIPQIEEACDAAQPFDFRRHPLEGAALSLTEQFFFNGFPVEVRTNAPEILDRYRLLWGQHRSRYDAAPITVEVLLLDDDSAECPAAPRFQMMFPLMFSVADCFNYSVYDLARGTTQICISRALLHHPLYADYFFLESAAACHVSTRYATPIHAGCVEWNGHGMLLCGDSGAGKSTLSYACARSGFGYVSDDATFLLHDAADRIVTGDPHKVRMRPESVCFFAEMEGLGITPRAAGKPSVEMRIGPGITGLEETRADYVVFLNRRTGRHLLQPYRRDVARQFMRQVLFGLPDQLLRQYRRLEDLLTVPIFELHYTDLDWAVARLRSLAQDGR